MSKPKTTVFVNERKDTDESLTAEREKTNRSLSNARKITEKQTDLFVKNERLETDQTRLNIRDDADAERDSLRDQNSPTQKITAEQKANDDRLTLERHDADRAVNQERLRVDRAIEQERELKKSKMDDVLEQERVLTDRNLSTERLRTDDEVEKTTGRLSEEIANHLKTKVSLTTRDEILAIVSHDLRNPIGAIATCADMILEDYHQTMNPEVKKFLQLIQRNAKTGLRLIEDILDMESIAMGQFQLELKRTNIGLILTEIKENFTLLASEKLIVIEIEQQNLSVEFVCDRERIKQIITNIIANAIKFTPVKGTVRIEVKTLLKEIQISIHDTGPGIPDSKKLQIFERFAQLGQNDRRGLGLGLYISKMLTEAHCGRLWVQSQEGQGSHFYISLPMSGSESLS